MSEAKRGRGVPDVKSAIKDIQGSVAQPFALPRKPRSDAEAQRLYYHIRTICYWLDAASDIVRIPGLSDKLPFSFGIDAIVGTLLPLAGDVLGLVFGLYVVLLSMQFGLPAAALGKMFINVIIDALVGIIPIIGDLVDLAFKANLRNLSILEDHLLNNPPPRPAANAAGLSSPSTHFAIRIPPAGPFWPKESAPTTEAFYASADSTKRTSTSFFSNILGSPSGSGGNATKGWKLGGAKRVEIEQVGGWSGESAHVLWRWVVAYAARAAGKTQQAAGAAKQNAKKAY